MTTIGIIGAGHVGSQVARAAIANGYTVVIANSRGPEPSRVSSPTWDRPHVPRPPHRPRRPATSSSSPRHSNSSTTCPSRKLAGKIVLDTNNYTTYRDGNFPMIDSGEKTVHELRQEQLPKSKVATAFTLIRAEILLHRGRPAGAPDRLALAVSSDFPEAVELVTRLNDQFGYDTVDNGPLSESWRFGPGTPAWRRADGTRDGGQGREELVRNLKAATRPRPEH